MIRRLAESNSKASIAGWINSSFEDGANAGEGIAMHGSTRTTKRKRETKTVPKKKKPAQLPKGEDEGISWSEKFCPKKKEELAVHSKKVAEVENWLKTSFQNFHRGHTQGSVVLLLTGPAGSGRTATITALSKELQFEVCEWSSSPFQGTSVTQFMGGTTHLRNSFTDVPENQASVFHSFLLRANKYNPLFSDHPNRVVLVEEFPNVFLKDPSSFHNILRNYNRVARCPIVFIVSESTTENSLEYLLFPKTLQLELKVHHINFNPVAPTNMMNALKRIYSGVENCHKCDLEGIVSDSMGDIRNAVNMLQFMSISKTPAASLKSDSQLTKNRRSGKGRREKLPSQNGRNSSLFLFHALGKILHCKRDASKQSDMDKLPQHLSHLQRLPLQENPEEVFSRTSITSESFALFLHENYLMFVRDLDAASNSASFFSEADVVCTEWTGRDILKEYSASLAARGLMFNLNPDGSRSKWETLRKPQYFSIVKDNRSATSSLKIAFKENRLSLEELETELVPYLHKLRVPLKNNEQSSLVHKIGQMSVRNLTRHPSEYLNMRDAVIDDDADIAENPGLHSVVLQSMGAESHIVTASDEEEIEIEECDF